MPASPTFLSPFERKWVEGHQRECRVTDLDWWAKANNFVDSEAKICLQQESLLLDPTLPLEKSRLLHKEWGLSVHGCKQSWLRPNFICAMVPRPSAPQWSHEHHDLPVPWAAFPAPHWSALHLAAQQLLLLHPDTQTLPEVTFHLQVKSFILWFLDWIVDAFFVWSGHAGIVCTQDDEHARSMKQTIVEWTFPL